MNRVFCPELKIANNTYAIADSQQVHHLKNVLRVEAGDELVVFDGRGQQYLCQVQSVAISSVTVRVLKPLPAHSRQLIELAVACAIPKQTKMDDIIDKLTQLGVQRIIPMDTERVIVRLDAKKALARQQRWEKIALSAVKQSQRNTLVTVDKVRTFDEVLAASARYGLKLIPALIGDRILLKDALAARQPDAPVLVMIGPEGDFSPAEIDAAQKKGFIPVSLGETVLRVDTAAIACAAHILFSS